MTEEESIYQAEPQELQEIKKARQAAAAHGLQVIVRIQYGYSDDDGWHWFDTLEEAIAEKCLNDANGVVESFIEMNYADKSEREKSRARNMLKSFIVNSGVRFG